MRTLGTKMKLHASALKSEEGRIQLFTVVFDVMVPAMKAQPTVFHKFIDMIYSVNRLLRWYNQNFDPLGKPEERRVLQMKGPWPTLVDIHGDGRYLRCGKRAQHVERLRDFIPEGWAELCFREKEANARGNEAKAHGDVHATKEAVRDKKEVFRKKYEAVRTLLPRLVCEGCIDDSEQRAKEGKRKRSPGKLRPDILLYGEQCNDETVLWEMQKRDAASGPAVLVVGTTLKTDSARKFAYDFCQRSACAVWVNLEAPPKDLRLHHVFEMDCQEFAAQMMSYLGSRISVESRKRIGKRTRKEGDVVSKRRRTS